MLDFVYSPRWFCGNEIIIDIVSILVLFLIGFFSFTYYRIKRKREHLSLASAFLMLSLALIFKTLTNFTVLYHLLETKRIGLITITYEIVKSSDIPFYAGFLPYRLLTLLGLYMLYSIYHKQSRTTAFVIIYLLFVSTYFSYSAYYAFHLTALTLLALITVEYFKNYRKGRGRAAMVLTLSFALITISQVFFIFLNLHTIFYVIAALLQLAGYSGLLITFIMVLIYGKKKR